jgi:hypothetical protein
LGTQFGVDGAFALGGGVGAGGVAFAFAFDRLQRGCQDLLGQTGLFCSAQSAAASAPSRFCATWLTRSFARG